MKICPICDNKISGTWCKNCHRFVKPWELKKDIYINETHSSSHDAGCEYHNPSISYDRQEYMQPGYENKVYGNAAGTQQRQNTQQRQRTQQNNYTQQNRSTGARVNGQKKSGSNVVKVVRWVIIIYVIIIFLSVIASFIPVVESEFGSFSNFIDEIIGDKEKKESVNTRAEEEVKNSSETLAVEVTEENREKADHDFLSAITPVSTEKTEYGETYEYYDVSDVQSLNHACDAMHMDFTIDDFLDMMSAVFMDYDITMEGHSDETMNYMVDYSWDDPYVWFEAEFTAVCEEFTLVVSADTSTGEVHSYEFRAYDAQDEFYTAVYSWFEAYVPEAFSSRSDMLKFFDDVKETGGYKEMESNDFLISCFLLGGYVSVTVGPLY
ncbi:MAG: hypothetical protein PUF12_11435 [Thermoflexaceae bacterium]|nr:hypothetical protein [Thermoflexaceae bacterium]